MEDIQIYNFTIKSKIHNYSVNFINNFEQQLDQELISGDYIILDERIKQLFEPQLSNILNKYQHHSIIVSESQKSYQGIIPIIQILIEKGFRKNHRLIGIGGGIVQDITAFIASIIYRGVDWLFFPTTLLSQGDSCIGSKTSINFGEFKNQIGGFYPPCKIFIYPDFIKTLPDAEIKSGMGEMLHYFIVSGRDDFNMFRDLFKDAISKHVGLAKIIARSLEIKKKYIEVDEFDQNVRQVFNYGHSFGHAIESLTHYKIPHGIAVSFGMDIANFISIKMGFLNERIRNEIREVTEEIWKGYSIENIDIKLLINALSKDKKNVGSKFGLILNKGYGDIFKTLIEPDDNFRKWLNDYFTTEL
jgi:3-dehydroquinate synthase